MTHLAVVVVQLAECLLTIPEVGGSNPVKHFLMNILTVEKTKIKDERGRERSIQKTKRGTQWYTKKLL